ncbi:MAG: hypothetical protein NUW37_18060 [Planctomycetes bacterium]|nr:hypothetical protein [Planctomycetota bacterium]
MGGNDFRDSKSIDQLADEQGVRPVTDLSNLRGAWPGEVDDGFEEEINHLRNQNISGEEDG